MCLPLIGAAVGLVGTAVSFSAAQQQAAMEQQIAERNARMEELRGRYEAKQIDRKVRYMQGKAAVQASAAGIGQGGSFLDIIADNAVQGRVHDIAYLGNLSTYHVELPGGRIVKAQTANTRAGFMGRAS